MSVCEKEKRLADPDRQSPIDVRELGVEQVDQVFSLHCRLHRQLADRRYVYDRPREYFEALLVGGEGAVLGAFADGSLLGYSTVRLRCGDDELSALSTFVPQAEWARVALHGSTLVDERLHGSPAFKRLFAERIRLVRAHGFFHSIAIAFALNRGSIALAFRHRFLLRETLVDNDGDNFVLHLDHTDPCRDRATKASRRVVLSDSMGHRAALAAGLIGVRLGRQCGEPAIEYSHFN